MIDTDSRARINESRAAKLPGTVGCLADLEDEYDVLDCGDRTRAQVDADVLRAVQDILDHRDGRTTPGDADQ